jgi:adenylate cyclase
MQDLPTGCVLFADVSGSTRLGEAVGDAAAHEAVTLCVKLFSALTLQHGGRVVKAAGDEVMALFPEASQAASAAVDIQLGMTEMAPVDKQRLGVRIGLHHGPVLEKEGDVFGETVNFAARLTEMAAKGQIVASLSTVDRLAPIQKMDCRSLCAIAVEGEENEVRICEMLWSDADDATQFVAQHASTDGGTALRIVYRTRVLTLSQERASLVLGREATVDLVVPDRMASRVHCHIEHRQDRFVLVDRSANGTYLTVNGDPEIVLRNEEAALRNHGFIALGQSRQTATEVVEFFCE